VKIYLVLSAFLVVCSVAMAQQDTTALLYKRFPAVPPISLLKSDSGLITKAGLKKNQPVLLMYFSPECHHCQHQMEDMIKRMDDLKKVQIVLATYQPMEELVSFENKYQLKQYSNVRAGRDTKFFIVPFFKIRNLPYLALYNKKGNLITTYEGNVKMDTLIQAFR
jgi:thioredoxin-related protein